MPSIKPSTFSFLKDVAKNNNRDWFAKNKDRYTDALEDVKVLQASILSELSKVDEIDKSKIYRIYRDVRFSKDKTPYNPNFRLSFSRAGAYRRGGYFLRLEPDNTYVAAGFWAPESADLKLIRSHIAQDPKSMRKAISYKKFKDHFEHLEGDQVKSAPKGYSKDHEAIDLLRYKQYIVSRKIPDHIVGSESLVKEIVSSFKAVLPFFNYMSDILTHDLNGVPLYD